MICPYCRNEINNNSTKCEVCGVDLEDALNNRRNYRTVSIISLVVGIICIVITITCFLMQVIGSVLFDIKFGYSDIPALSNTFSALSCIVGMVFTGIGIYGLCTSKNPKPTTRSSQNITSTIVFAVLFILIYITFTSYSFFINAYSKFGMDAKTGNLFLIPFAITSLLMLFGFVISFFKGNRK